MRVKWMEYKEKIILFVDCSGIKDQEVLIGVVEEASIFLEKSLGKVLMLSDMTDAVSGPDFMEKIKGLTVTYYDKFDKTAVIGIVGLKVLLLRGSNMFMKKPTIPFGTKEEALDYLVS